MSNDIQIENDVLLGREGYLFLAQGGHSVLDITSRTKNIDENSLDVFATNYRRRAEVCRTAGVKHFHIIYPDKQSVLPHYYPIREPVCLGQELLKRHKEMNDNVGYPVPELMAATAPSFMKCDTHLTDAGSIVVAATLVRALTGENQDNARDYLISKTNVAKLYTGDLGSKLTPNRSNTEYCLPVFWPLRWFHNEMSGGNNGLVDLWFSFESVYQSRVLFFGDSFGREACKILSYFFKEVVFVRTPYFHDEIFHAVMPDYVVTENVERYLASCTLDDSRPWFTLYPALASGSYEPSKDFARAFSAVLSYPRSPYFEFVQTLLARTSSKDHA